MMTTTTPIDFSSLTVCDMEALALSDPEAAEARFRAWQSQHRATPREEGIVYTYPLHTCHRKQGDIGTCTCVDCLKGLRRVRQEVGPLPPVAEAQVMATEEETLRRLEALR